MGNAIGQPTKYDIYARELVDELPKINDSYKFEIKPSARTLAGNGVFALEDISAGTILPLDNAKIMNDLAYDVEVIPTYTIDSVKKHTNIINLVRNASPAEYMFTNASFIPLALKVIKDIKAGEELSRCYGPFFWKEYDFWRIRPNCKWRETKLDKDLPDDFIFIDTCRMQLDRNYFEDLYGKKVGDKYYYQIHHYCHDAIDTIDINDVSLPHNVIMPIGYYIEGYGYRTMFLETHAPALPIPQGCIGRINSDGTFEKAPSPSPEIDDNISIVDITYGPPHVTKSVEPQNCLDASKEDRTNKSLIFRIINNPNISKRGVEVHDYRATEIHSTILVEPINSDIDFNLYVDGVIADIDAGKYNQYVAVP